jgi:tetratricopeptide (TPR) repeat protein
MLHLLLGRYPQAHDDLTRALQLDPKSGYALTQMVRLLVTGPSELWDSEKIVSLMNIHHENASYWSLYLGGNYYRLGDYHQAKTALTDALDHYDHVDEHTENLLLLAMTCRQLGEHEEARHWLEEAEAWMSKNSGPEDVHLRNMHREAADHPIGTVETKE